MQESRKRFLKRAVVTSVIAVPLLWLVLAPFPGLGMIFLITDALRGHPHSKHGTQPSKFVGFWVREQPVEFGFSSEAFFLMQDSTVATTPGLARRSWHFDSDVLSLDYVSLCGNCYAGVRTSDFTVQFDGPDRLQLTPVHAMRETGVHGWYRRTEITDELKKVMNKLLEKEYSTEASHGHSVLRAIEQYEFFVAKGRS